MKKAEKKMDVSPLENKGEILPIKKEILSNKVDRIVVIKEHDGLGVGHVVEASTPEIVNMMIEKGYWKHETSEDK